jgi:ABC-2 type transport system permease protein
MKAFWQLYLAKVKEFVRDRMAMFWTLAFPIFFIVIFGVIFSGSSGTTFDVGLVVEDHGPAGRALEQAFRSVPAFNISEGNRTDLMATLKNGKLRALIVVPDGVSAAVSRGKPAQVETYYDPTSQTTAQIVLTIVDKVVQAVDQSLTQRPTLLSVTPMPITATNLGEIDFLLPGILAMSLMQLGLFATAPALVQLREQQVLRRIGATPLPRITLLAAQVAHRQTIGGVQTFLILLIGRLAFKVNIVGNLALLLAFVLLGALMFVALGYLISGLARTQDPGQRDRHHAIAQLSDDVPVGYLLPGRPGARLDQAGSGNPAPDLSGRCFASNYGWRHPSLQFGNRLCRLGRLAAGLRLAGRTVLQVGIGRRAWRGCGIGF